MTRAGLFEKLTPAKRYTRTDDATLQSVRSGQYLFAATATNAGYFLLTDVAGQLQPLTTDLLGALVREARFYGVKLRNMRIFGARSGLNRVPASGRYYDIGYLS